MAYRKMSLQERTLRSLRAREAAAERRSRKRWYIAVNFKPPSMYLDKFGYPCYRKNVWPMLFHSYESAMSYGLKCKALWKPPVGKRKVASFSIETIYLAKVEP